MVQLQWWEWVSVPPKPSGMHWVKYSALVHAAASAEWLANFDFPRGWQSVPPSRLPWSFHTPKARLPHVTADWQKYWKEQRKIQRQKRLRMGASYREFIA